MILGAGFDSRGIRFGVLAKDTRIFEMDAETTQQAKIEWYREKGIKIPQNLVFIPIDFDKQSISERLLECGFEKGRKSLIILEGLTMYLQPESVGNLFAMLGDFAGLGSVIVFDFIHASVLRRENLYRGEKELVESVAKNGKGFCFGLEEEDLSEFLSRYGFAVSDVSDSAALEKRFFADENGKPQAYVNSTHCIVCAIRE